MFAETVTDIAADLRARRYSSAEITEHYLARIADLDPALNTYITVCTDLARATAARADALLARVRAGPSPASRTPTKTSSVPAACGRAVRHACSTTSSPPMTRRWSRD
jgi:aspartyl-tRNA(Asn)/glutamyl-tRNA(Gln) amidotransferase subunit A